MSVRRPASWDGRALRRFRGASSVVLLLVLVAVALGVATAAPVAAENGAALALTPSAAEAGESTSAVASGFEECVQPPPPADTSSEEPFSAPRLAATAPKPGTIRVTWAGTTLTEAPLAGGAATVPLTVPLDTAPGIYEVGATCVQNEKLTDTASYTVLPPAAPTTVPTSPSTSPTRNSAPSSSATLPPGTTTLPSPSPTTAPRTVLVPAVVGLTAREAVGRLAGAGLGAAPVDAGDLERRVEGQSPVAGTAVPVGSTVDLTLRGSPPLPWRGATTGLATLAAAGLLGRHVLRGRLDRRWVGEHVDVRVGTDAAATEAVARPRSHEHDLAVRLRGYADGTGTQTLEEEAHR